MISLRTLLAVAAGGALGSSGRYLVAVLMTRWVPTWPLGTITVNLLGSLLLGFLATVAVSNNLFSPDMRLAVLTGFLGGFTTFSTYMYESVTALLEQRYTVAFGSLFGQLVVGLLACLIGIVAARTLIRS